MKEENNSIYVKLDYLDANVGQIEGVPENPRKITAEKWDKLMSNVLLYPEYLRMSRLKCLEYNGRYVVLGGNQRRDVLYAISTMGEKELLSCIKKAYEDIKPEGFEDGDIELMFEYWKDWQTKKDVPIAVTRESDTDTLKAYVALDNNSFGEYDWGKVKQGGWNVDKLVAWGTDGATDALSPEEKKQLSDAYSKNIGKVVYEPKDVKHSISELFRREDKFDELIEKIENEELRVLLKERAAWFTDFNFEKIADYYAYQATKEEQIIFEKLGLVLLDLDGLIENGFSDLIKDYQDEQRNQC